jgi:hypothetical protein
MALVLAAAGYGEREVLDIERFDEEYMKRTGRFSPRLGCK